jgi:hypothetical protein
LPARSVIDSCKYDQHASKHGSCSPATSVCALVQHVQHTHIAVRCLFPLLSPQAEKYKNEDEQQAKKIEAKNGLENYAYSMRNTIRDDKVADKLPADDKAKIEHAVEDVLKWLENNQLAEGESKCLLGTNCHCCVCIVDKIEALWMKT